MTRRILIGVVLSIGIMCFASAALMQSREELREEFHQTYPLSAGGQLTLQNINGAVHITGWDRNEVKVDAVKSAYRQDRLKEAEIVVDASSDSIDIRTRYPHRDLNFTNDAEGRYENPASVEYMITIPRSARIGNIELINGALTLENLTGDVKASSINGRLTARGLNGEAKLSTINGTLNATFERLSDAKLISLGSVNGSVELTIPSDASAQLKASTVHGSIKNDLNLPVHQGRYVGNDLAGQLGNGGTRIKLSNVNGSINIRRANDGRSLSPVTNLLTTTQDDADAPTQMEIERQVASEVEREMRNAQSEIARANRDAQREGERAARESQRAALDAQREVQASARELEVANREARREAAEAAREVALAERDIERERRDAERARLYGAKDTSSYRLIERDSKTFSVSGMPQVRIETFDGTISVQGWDKPEVMFTAVKRARDEQTMREIHLRAEQTGARIDIAATLDKPQRRGVWNTNASVSYELYVPRHTNLRAKSADGRLRIEGVNGEIEMLTSDGAVDAHNNRGRLHVKTSDGNIRITNFEGEAIAQTGDGRISLDGRFTQLQAHTGDGSISLTLPANADASIETNADHVLNDGLAVSEDGASEPGRVRRWRVGRGGSLLTLETGDGQIILRRSDDQTGAAVR